MALTLNVNYSSSPSTHKETLNSKKTNKNVLQNKRKNSPRKQNKKIISVKNKPDGEESDSDVECYKKLKTEARMKQTQHISSLFAHNPDIPSVEIKEVDPVQEAVFTTDLFKDTADLHPFMVKNLADTFGVTRLTTVQKLSVPVLLAGKDALIRSQTGSGKTLAYAVPVVEALRRTQPRLSRADGVRALVILPTRELALQTYECFVKLMRSFTWLVPGLVVGGEKRKSEKARLRRGVNVLVGTPGRISDHARSTHCLRLGHVSWLVLDEADRLLDLGYEKEIQSIVERLNEEGGSEGTERRQTVLLSATLTPQVERLAGLTLSSPVRLDASEAQETELVLPQSLEQFYVVTPAKLRLVTLAAFIHWQCKVRTDGKVVIFVGTQDMVDYLTELLGSVLHSAAQYMRLHGKMAQADRTRVWQTFQATAAAVLLCTDVAARGLDLCGVDWIVQFTPPTTAADYVHRVGRTARVGHAGKALLFLVPSETGFINKLQDKRIRLKEEQMVQCLFHLQSLEWEEDVRAPAGLESAATALQLRFEAAVLEQRRLHELACKAYISWVRFYAGYPKEVRDCFIFKDLHLGHFAKSFALRDPPSTIGGLGRPSYKQSGPGKRGRQHGYGQNDEQYQHKQPSKPRAPVSEFSSGLEPLKKKKKTA